MSTAVVIIGLTEKNVKATNSITAQASNGKKIMFPVFSCHGNKESLKKQVRKIITQVFSEFDEGDKR